MEVFYLLVVLAVITVLGHCIWVAVAFLLRALFGEEEKSPVRSTFETRCSECGTSLGLNDIFCPVCGKWEKLNTNNPRMTELAVTAQQMDRLLNLGLLDTETHGRVIEVIADARKRLTAPSKPEPVVASKLATEQERGPVIQPKIEQPAPIPPTTARVPLTIGRYEEREPVAETEREPLQTTADHTALPMQPRRTFTELLATFMEESSIKWGELIGGLLIIGCSIALVISLWSQIASKPFVKFSIFTTLTAGLFGLGFYSAHRWKLPTTSRGVLIIATLLVPLNFLAMSAFSYQRASLPVLVIGGEILALGLFLFLVYYAAHTIEGGSSWTMVLAVLAPSFAMLMAKYWGDPGRVVWLGVAPILCYWASVGATFRKEADRIQGDGLEDGVKRIFLRMGIASFATLLPLGLLMKQSGSFAITIQQFAPLICLFAAPAIACGALLLQRGGSSLSGEQKTAAMSIGIIGSMAATLSVAIAWPNPVLVITTAMINFGICIVVALTAVKTDFKYAHVAAIVHFAGAYLVVCNLLEGNIASWMNDGARLIVALASPRSGQVLLALFILLGWVAEKYRKAERTIEGRIYSVAAVLVGALSLLLVTFHGFGRIGDPNQAGLIYAIYAGISFGVAWRRQEKLAGWIGAVLSLLAIEQTLAFKFGNIFAPYHPTRLSLISFTSLSVVAIVLLRKAGDKTRKLFEAPFAYSALISSFVLVPLLLFGGWMTNLEIAIRLLWLSVIWLLISLVNGRRALFIAFHAAFLLAVTLSISASIGYQWPSVQMWLDPLTLQSEAIALAILSLMVIATHIWLRRKLESDNTQGDFWENERGVEEKVDRKLFDPTMFAWFLNPTRPSVDSIVNSGLLILLVTLSLIGVSVPLIEELTPRSAISPALRAFAATSIGAKSWLLLLALLLVFVTRLWVRFEKWAVLAMQFLVAATCLLLAGRWQFDGSATCSSSWSMAIGLSLITWVIVERDRVERFSQQFELPQMIDRAAGLARMSQRLSFVIFAFPIVVLALNKFGSFWPVLPISFGQNVSINQIVGVVISLTVPLLIVAGSVLANGLKDRSVVFTRAAGLLLNFAVTIGSLLAAVIHREEFILAVAIRTIHLNVITTSLFSIVWMAIANRWSWREPKQVISAQLAVVVGILLALFGLADVRLFIDPDINSVVVNAMGSMWAWVAVGVTGIAYARYHGWKLEKLTLDDFGAAAVVLGSLLTGTLSRLDDDWIAFRALMLVLIATAMFMIALRWIEQSGFKDRFPDWIVRIIMTREVDIWELFLGGAAILMTLRGFGSRWWTVGACMMICLLFTALGAVSRNRAYVYLAGIMPNLAAYALYGSPWFSNFDTFIVVSLVTLSLTALAGLLLDLQVLRKGKGNDSIKPFHRVAARFVFVIMWFEFGISLIDVLTSDTRVAHVKWVALISITTLLVGCLWDDESDFAPRWLWGAGLLVMAEAFLAIKPQGRGLIASSVVALSLYAFLTSIFFHQSERLSGLMSRLRIQAKAASERNRSFIIAANSILATTVAMLMVAAVALLESLPQRLIVTTASLVIPVSLLLLSDRLRNMSLITWGVRFSLFNVVLWGWAWLPVPTIGRMQMLQRLMIIMLISEAVIIAYRFILIWKLASDNQVISDEAKLGNEHRVHKVWEVWQLASDNVMHEQLIKAVGKELPLLAITGILALGGVLGIESWSYLSFGMSQMTMAMTIAMTLTLIGLIPTCIAFALLPGEDPFNLDERGKMRYVYAAEVVLALLMMHVRVTMPWMFSGFFLAWWPIIIMLVAFAGVGMGELFRRQGRLVLAEPIERTGIILPLLPVLGFWFINSEVSPSGFLLLVGLFYGVLSVMQRSFAFGILAALAGNGGLWRILNGLQGVGFDEHPQLWMIPMALSVLVAAWINRDQLKPERITAIRYVCLMTIYVSSTADIFINGIARSPWLPIVLAALSVIGVITGLVMRVRAFLFLGTAFLLLSIVAMIWTASVNLDWDWLWPVTGIVFGVVIIYIFAMFERKREEMMAMIEQLKQWQA